MKEIIQLNLTEEELTILQAFVAVGIMIHLKNAESLEKEISVMNYFMHEWPESNRSLTDKMTASVKISMDLLDTK